MCFLFEEKNYKNKIVDVIFETSEKLTYFKLKGKTE